MQRVSIVITTHNRPRLLLRAVESARRSGRDPEIVVVDDASTDETGKVCQSLNGIRYIRLDRQQGVACARNVGIKESSGKFICFLDDDDERLPDSLDLQVEYLESAPNTAMVYGQALLMEGSAASQRLYPEHCPQGDIFWELLGQNFIPCGSAVFRRSCLMSVGVLDESVPGIDDWDLWLRLAEHFNVSAIEQPVYSWRRSAPGSGQGSSSGARMVRIAVRQFRDQWMHLSRAVEAPHSVRRSAWKIFSEGMARHLVWEAARAQATGQTRQAAANIFTGLRLLPTAMLHMPFDRRRAGAVLGLVGGSVAAKPS
jgi:glycosyltransferase involved in cell wall biosynthesis